MLRQVNVSFGLLLDLWVSAAATTMYNALKSRRQASACTVFGLRAAAEVARPARDGRAVTYVITAITAATSSKSTPLNDDRGCAAVSCLPYNT